MLENTLDKGPVETLCQSGIIIAPHLEDRDDALRTSPGEYPKKQDNKKYGKSIIFLFS